MVLGLATNAVIGGLVSLVVEILKLLPFNLEKLSKRWLRLIVLVISALAVAGWAYKNALDLMDLALLYDLAAVYGASWLAYKAALEK